ncbi:hypothetical protein KFU94_22340 [Chloroflexi bacterium TSY]|nr:hypothetical protein [Chloroflexi bacterium TSY]
MNKRWHYQMLRFWLTSPAQTALQIIAIVSFIISAVWFVTEPSFEPILAFLGGAAALISSFVDTRKQNNNFDAGSKTASQHIKPDNHHDNLPEPVQQKSAQSLKLDHKVDKCKKVF